LEKIEVLLSPEAQDEFEELLGNKVFGGLAKRYFKELNDFPPEDWGDIHSKEGESLFKSDNHVIFDIQGKIIFDKDGHVEAVKIVRFRLRHKV
jgi:hypothetical protein